jgi:hypothetical protein
MWDDLTKTVKAQLYERASSPLFGSFALAWGAWNYKFIMVVLSSMTATEKIGYIDLHIYKTYWDVLSYGFAYPLISSVVFIFLYPIAAKYPYKYWQTQQAALKKIKQAIEDETPLPQAEARDLRRQAAQASIEFDKELASKTAEIQQLREMLSEAQTTSTTELPQERINFAPQYQRIPEPLLEGHQMEMLQKLAENSDEGIQRDVLIKESGSDKIAAEYDIDRLQEFQYANEFSDENIRRLRITQKGRARLIEERKKQVTMLEQQAGVSTAHTSNPPN